MSTTQRFYDLADSTVEFFQKVLSTTSLEHSGMEINYSVIGDAKQKQLIDIKKIPAHYEFTTKKQIQVTINEDMFDKLDGDDALEILFKDCINRIEVNIDKETIKIGKYDVITTSGVLKSYGQEKVLRAKELERDLHSQMKEEESEKGEGLIEL